MVKDILHFNLRRIRKKADLSLARTAELTGVSKAMLGQIERGESSPTLNTIWKLAKGFHVPLTAFIEGLTVADTSDLANAPSMVEFVDELKFQTLLAFDPVLGSESFLIHLSCGQTHLSNGHDAGVIEDIIPFTAGIEVLVAQIWQPLKPEQALRFAADQPHGYRNLSAMPARFLNTIHYPKSGLLD